MDGERMVEVSSFRSLAQFNASLLPDTHRHRCFEEVKKGSEGLKGRWWWLDVKQQRTNERIARKRVRGREIARSARAAGLGISSKKELMQFQERPRFSGFARMHEGGRLNSCK